MKHFLYACVIAVMVLASAGVSAPSLMAQASTLPPEDLLLRIEEDQQWMFTGGEGARNVDEIAQVVDGEPQVPLNPETEAYYQEHNVGSVHIFRAQIRPVNNTYEQVATGVELRVMSFETAADASSYQMNFFELVYEEDRKNNDGNEQLQLMEAVPDSPYPTIGWTFQETYRGADGNPLGAASGLRLIAQHESTLVTVRVQGPFADFNFDFANALLDHQLDCVVQNVVCEPVQISSITPAWRYVMGTLFYVNDANEGTSARFLYPTGEPVRAPEMGTIFDAGSASNETTADAGSTTRTTRSGDSSGSSRVVRTPRTSTNNDSSGTTRTTRTVRTSTATTNAEPANATVIVEVADVFADPDTNADVLITLTKGDRVTVTGEPELVGTIQWVPVVTESGEKGWMLIQDIWKD